MALDTLKLVGIVEVILIPIQRILSRLITEHLEEDLKDKNVRQMIVDAADIALCSQVPEAKLIPEEVRKEMIRKLLDMMLDDILLPESKK